MSKKFLFVCTDGRIWPATLVKETKRNYVVKLPFSLNVTCDRISGVLSDASARMLDGELTINPTPEQEIQLKEISGMEDKCQKLLKDAQQVTDLLKSQVIKPFSSIRRQDAYPPPIDGDVARLCDELLAVLKGAPIPTQQDTFPPSEE